MNNISSILYNLTIYPFELIIDSISVLLTYTDQGVKLIIIGVVINLIAIPLYNIADILQKKESALQKKFKPKIDEIKAVFSGDKRQMLIQTYYRINNYHPVYSIRGLIGLLIQIPIFIAAYSAIVGMNFSDSFLMIKDLSKPDALLQIGTWQINVLPIIMTAVNIISSIIHTKDLTNKERRPLFVMASLFLVLLYNSPSALLVYWTTTNLFSLIKNLILINPKPIVNFFKRTKKVWIILSVAWLLSPLLFYFQIAKAGSDTFRVIVPGIIAITIAYINAIASSKKISENYQSNNKVFLISIVSLSILFGLFIPSSLVGSSPQEFENPFNIIVNTMSKSAGIFLTYPLLLYFLGSEKMKRMFTLGMIFIFLFAMVNTFIFSGNYGSLSGSLIFDNKDILITTSIENILNISLAIIILLLIWKKLFYKELFKTISTISVIILFLISSFNLYNIHKETKVLLESKEDINNNINRIIDLSNNGKNVFVFFFDASVASYIPDILKNMPHLQNELDGFKYYNNTISFGTHTVSTISSLFGGYEYSPTEMNKRDKETLKDKHDESIMVLPLIFRSNNYSATVIYPSYAGFSLEPNISSFRKYTDVKVYSRPFSIAKNQNNEEIKQDFDNIVLNFSLFKISPMSLRYFIYNDGKWMLNKYASKIPSEVIEYTYLKELTNMVNIVSNTNTYTYFGNDMTHDSDYFNSNYLPELEKKEIPKEDLEKYGNEKVARRMYNNTRMLTEVASFVKFLKENNMYDNTKIIVISDHGDVLLRPIIFDIARFNFNEEINNKLQGLHATLLVKDFNSKGVIKIDTTNFMTIADMPIIATSHISNVQNPFTKRELKADKEDGIQVMITPFSIRRQKLNKFHIEAMINIKNGNIFDMDNWSKITN